MVSNFQGWFATLGDKALNIYQEHEKIAAPTAFLGGVTYDSLTITRIDRLFENLIILLYLVLLGAAIVAYARMERGTLKWNLMKKYDDYLHLAIQFLMGGLLSVYTIFYFRSTTLSRSGLFVLLLVALLLANEFLTDRLLNRNLLVVLYFFVWLSFCVFFVPVMVGHMSDFVFYASSLISLFPALGLLYFIYHPDWLENIGQIVTHSASILLLCFGIFFLYGQNLIPPIPLSMEEGGAYYEITRSNGKFHLTYDRPSFYEFLETSADPFYWTEGEPVYCFVSIFAPTDFQTNVRHEWQRYDAEESAWITTDNLNYEIQGGRRGGYRGYTFKRNVQPGSWRVNVWTMGDRLVGRVSFEIVSKPEGEKLEMITRDV